jgi:hypothetical protein
MAKDMYSVVMRILDDQNRLTDRADTKAISLLSTLGIFSVIFIAQLDKINIVPFTILLLVVYFISVILAVLHIVMAISPRIRTGKNRSKNPSDKAAKPQPTFFGGICQYPDVDAYKKTLDDLVSGDEAINDTYIRQVYEVAKINNVKYKYVGRAVWFVVIAIFAQVAFIAFAFAEKLG